MSAQLSLKQKLGFLPVLASIWASILCALVTGLFNRQAKTWYLHIAYAALRTATKKLSPLQLQYVLFLVVLSIASIMQVYLINWYTDWIVGTSPPPPAYCTPST